MEIINYNNAQIAGKVGTTSVTTSEVDLLTISDAKHLMKSQMTSYFNVTLGSATKVTFRYYFSPDNGSTWYLVPTQDKATSVLVNVGSAIIDSTSYSTGGVTQTIYDLPMSGGYKFKITGQATTATATLNSLIVMVRDN